MAYARAAAQITVDNAACDGRITVLGVGRDWTADEPRNTLGLDQRTPDVGGMYGWWYNGLFEHITRLNCIAPIMTCTPASMALSGWTVARGLWRGPDTTAIPPGPSIKSGALGGVGLLEYYDSLPGRYAAGAWGQIVSNATRAPNLLFHFWRLPSHPEETDPGILEIILQGAVSGELYCIGFPSYGDAGAYGTAQGRTGWQTHPYLMGKRSGDTAWTLIDNLNVGAGPRSGRVQRQAELLPVKVEYLDNALLVRTHEDKEPWVFSGQWFNVNTNAWCTFGLADAGVVGINVIGHPALVGCWQLAAPASALLYPRVYYIRSASPPQEPRPAYKLIGAAPAGTGLSVAIDTNPGDSNQKRPAVTFTSSGGKRACLYNVQEYRVATIDSAISAPVTVTGDPTFRPISMTGHMERWFQGATCEIDYKCIPGHVLNEMRPNAKVSVQIGALPNGGSMTWYQIFVGYAQPPEKTRSHAITSGKVTCMDMVAARLRRKCVGWHCSYEGWPIDGAFAHILNRAGVDSSLISIDAAINPTAMGALYYLPTSAMRGSRRRLQFPPSKKVTAALDELVKLRNCEWGVFPTGQVFLRPLMVHTSGHYDFVLDDTAAAENMILDFRHKRSGKDFANLLEVMVGQGVDAAAQVMVDTESWSNSSSARFIGDLWMRFESYPSGDDLTAISARLWEEITHWDSLISWKEMDRPGLLPCEEVQVNVDASLNITAGSIYRVTDKRWGLREDGRFEQTLEGQLVEAM